MGEVHDYGYSTKEIISDLQSKIEQLQAEKEQQNIRLIHARQNVETLSSANEKLDIEREKLRAEKEQLEKEKAHLATMNKRYLGKMQEQQDAIENAKNIIEKHDPFLPTLTVLALEKALRGES